jgi:hypothetical protein
MTRTSAEQASLDRVLAMYREVLIAIDPGGPGEPRQPQKHVLARRATYSACGASSSRIVLVSR